MNQAVSFFAVVAIALSVCAMGVESRVSGPMSGKISAQQSQRVGDKANYAVDRKLFSGNVEKYYGQSMDTFDDKDGNGKNLKQVMAELETGVDEEAEDSLKVQLDMAAGNGRQKLLEYNLLN